MARYAGEGNGEEAMMDMEVGSTQSTGMDLNKNLSSAGLRNCLVKYFPGHIGFCDHSCFHAHLQSKLFVKNLKHLGCVSRRVFGCLWS
jgi:hypothetical protein